VWLHLAGASKEDVVAAVHEHLRGVAAGLVAGAVPLGKFVITKQLTKRLEDYPDAKNQPHVQVGLGV
jgi:DNA polymerase alpha subunit A